LEWRLGAQIERAPSYADAQIGNMLKIGRESERTRDEAQIRGQRLATRENSAAEAIDRDLVLFDRAIGLDASVGQFGVALGECPYAGAEEGFDPTAHHDQLYTQAPNVILVFSVNAHLLSHDR